MPGAPRIVILGGGFAGLESAFVLRSRLGADARITIVSDRREFLFKPNTIYIPFGADVDSLLIPLAKPARKRDIELVIGRVEDVDPDRRRVRAGGDELAWDHLVIATGSGMRPEEIPGLREHAETIWTPEQMSSLGARLASVDAEARRGRRQRILFSVPHGNKCAGPLYEIVLMVDTWLRRRSLRSAVDVTFATYEDGYIQAFGPKLAEVVSAEFERREIAGLRGRRVESVDAGRVRLADGDTLECDLHVTFPPYVAAVEYPHFPRDERGFLLTEPASRRVSGHDRVFAPGDAGDFPVKQAFLAFLQADAVADHIAADVRGREPGIDFEPTSMCVMEEFDKATFAQVPLRVTGDPNHPVAVRADANGAYRVGVSPAWRIGKKMLGLYLPIRFRSGKPFHAGVPWQAMEAGLKVMSAALARR